MARYSVLLLLAPWAAAPTTPDDGVEYFERRVRPILSEHCYSCHSRQAKKVKANFLLDDRASILKGGDSGPALVPGEPEASLLVRAVRYADESLRMPPRRRLPDEAVATLVEWVRRGAPAPDRAPPADASAPERHWAFRPLAPPPVPAVGARNPVDAFVLAKLRERGMTLSPRADARTLARRASFDLVGLPPEPGDADEDFERLVDRMLASPHYGERWGRHWLDVARYSDTKGYVFRQERMFPYAYTYRDWVVRALNEDMPYDRFVLCQLAADRLDTGGDRRPLAALGFLTLGRRFLEAEPDIIDDRIDVATRGLLGLTVGCARCHNHKYDPVTIEDYYALYGVFASSEEPLHPPDLGEPPPTPEVRAFAAELEKKKAALEEFLKAKHREIVAELRSAPVVARYAEAARRAREFTRDPEFEDLALRSVLRKEALIRFASSRPIEPRLEEVPLFLHELERRKYLDRIKDINHLRATHPGAPPAAMALLDKAVPVEPRVFLRGNPHNPGPRVPRRFLSLLGGTPFTDGSGRLGLARAIASRENPLTARVIVNRVWMHHFGEGLVRTPSDFGARGDPPTHPELLDWLSWRFVEEGWSIKMLHRRIMTSETYRQAWTRNPEFEAKDPENRLLWRWNRRRLDWETLRDSLLWVSGRLDPAVGGRPEPYLRGTEFSRRRTLYVLIDRQNPNPAYRTFDFANPDVHTPRRHATLVPQQPLFLMNDPFVLDLIPSAAGAGEGPSRVREIYRRLFQREPTPEEVELGLGFVRAEAAVPVAPGAGGGDASPWEYGVGRYDEDARRLATFTPLTYFTGEAWQGGPHLPDPRLGRVTLTAIGGMPGEDATRAAVRRWTAPRDGEVEIEGTLGHQAPEGDGIRGWVVLGRTGAVASWTLQNTEVRTRVRGLAVRRGDHVDFVVDPKDDAEWDGFNWAPAVRLRWPGGERAWSAEHDFRGPAGGDVRAPSAWEKYVHVLLMSNEFHFVD